MMAFGLCKSERFPGCMPRLVESTGFGIGASQDVKGLHIAVSKLPARPLSQSDRLGAVTKIGIFGRRQDARQVQRCIGMVGTQF